MLRIGVGISFALMDGSCDPIFVFFLHTLHFFLSTKDSLREVGRRSTRFKISSEMSSSLRASAFFMRES